MRWVALLADVVALLILGISWRRGRAISNSLSGAASPNSRSRKPGRAIGLAVAVGGAVALGLGAMALMTHEVFVASNEPFAEASTSMQDARTTPSPSPCTSLTAQNQVRLTTARCSNRRYGRCKRDVMYCATDTFSSGGILTPGGAPGSSRQRSHCRT